MRWWCTLPRLLTPTRRLSLRADVTLLQTQYNFLDSSSSATIYLIGTVIVAGVAALIIFNALRTRGRGAAPARTDSKRAFLCTAREHGLDKSQGETLLTLTRMARVKQPYLVFSNQGLLDDVLKRGF